MQFRATVRRSTSTSVAAAATLGLLMGAFGAAEANDEPILAHIFDHEHIFHKVSERFMGRLDELSDGDFKVQYHPGGDLGDWTSITEQVMHGTVEMTLAWNHTELDQRWNIAHLGFVVDDWESAEAVYGTASPLEEIYRSIAADLDMVLLGVLPIDFRGFVVREGHEVPVEFPEDADGFEMRVPGDEIAIKRYEALGFSPVPMAFEEVHTALQTGAIDGRAYSPPSEVLYFEDVIGAYVYTREDFEHTFWLASRQWFESLSDEQKDWVRQASKEAVSWSWDVAEQESERWLSRIREAGVDVVELSAEERADYREVVVGAERPFIKEIVGADLLSRIEQAAGD